MERNIYLNGTYLHRNPTYHTEDSRWKAQQVLKMLARYQLPIQTVCEVGCGAGEILLHLQRHMPPETLFYGYDISPQAYALCKPHENERLTFYCEDLLSKDTPPFDLLLCLDVLEHVEDYMGFLRKLRGKGRYKLFHIPLDLSVQTVLRSTPILRARESVGHLHYFTKETALLTLRDSGYEVVDYFYTPTVEQGKGFIFRLIKIPRRMLMSLSADLTVRLLGGHSLLVLAQ